MSVIALSLSTLTTCVGVDDASDPSGFTPITREDHAAHFPITSGTPHLIGECNDCHGNFDTFMEFDCRLACHNLNDQPYHSETAEGTRHALVQGYAYIAVGCYSCHPTGIQGTYP